ncbi:PAS domain-containing protein [Thetidibacter halocola]|uniref:PAS domain-containing protein n=1 Tax=Thetidibacter halocola TaxID=2827239 RepID=A0A8J7W7X6_9RHOB|nr:PAS domain-containing protein [Thetidibacter halocola]MBS0122557.1 PAS domain-containing protein [Thetidibacter halocola]
MFGNGGNDQDIVSMTDRDKARRLAPLRTVEAYWHGLCDGTQVPLRSDVDPRGMENALEFAFLIERIAPSLAKIRVAGSHLSDLLGMQVAGMPLSSFIAPEDRDRFGAAVARLFADPAVVRITLEAEGGFGKPAMTGHIILMPLRSDFGEVSRGLGAMVTDGRIGRTPRRFRVTAIDVESAPSAGVVAPATTGDAPAPRAPRPAPAVTLPPAAPARSTAAAPQRQRGHLRLVVSND